MIEKLASLINLLPNNGKFGKLISILALMMVGYYTDENGDMREVSPEEMDYLKCMIFYREGDQVKYKFVNPIGKTNWVVVNCLGCPPIYFQTDGNYTPAIIKVCNNLGFNSSLDYMSFGYALNSNIMILRSTKKEA